MTTIVQLTWQSHVAFIYDRQTFAQVDQFGYVTEGWGITHDGARWIMSDGSATLRFLDPVSHGVTGSVEVLSNGNGVQRLNELEYVNGEVLANVWLTDNIVRIDPASGAVLGWIDCAGLLDGVEGAGSANVLNGIAYDAAGDRLFLTGKDWPRLFEVALVPAE